MDEILRTQERDLELRQAAYDKLRDARGRARAAEDTAAEAKAALERLAAVNLTALRAVLKGAHLSWKVRYRTVL